MEDDIQSTKDYLQNQDNYMAAPEQYEFDEYELMKTFALNLNDPVKQDRLLAALAGKGAFRRFKDTIAILGAADAWYKFRDKAFEAFLREWCEACELEVVER